MDLAKLHLHWRESKYKDKTYRSYSLARPYRKNGKNRKEIVLKLGKLTDEEADRWRYLLNAVKKPGIILTNLDDIAVTEHFDYLDVAAASAVWEEWKLDHVFKDKGKREFPFASIARILTVNRCIDPSSKSQTPKWFQTTALPWMLELEPDQVNPSRIFRELDAIESQKEALCSHLFAMIRSKYPGSMKSVFYDLSSTTFTGNRCVLVKWGHCKEGYRNHVVLALVVNRDGLPFYWETLPGNTADATTIAWLLDRLKERFKINETTLVFDRGMVSDDNLALLEEAKVKYISAMDRNQLEGITGFDFAMFSHLNSEGVNQPASQLPGFSRLKDDVYYREVKVEGQRRYLLCFNPQLFKDQRKARGQAVEDFRSFINQLNAGLLEARNSRQSKPTYEKFRRELKRAKLRGFVDVVLRIKYLKRKAEDGSLRKVRTYQGTVVVDEEKMLLAGRLDGFWLLVTNQAKKESGKFKLSAQDAIIPYRDKVVIEAAFRDIKSFLEVSPVYVWTETHVKAHYTICVLSHLINRTLTLRLHNCPGKLTKEIVSHEKLYKRLSCKIDRIEVEDAGLATYNMTRPTAEEQELLYRVDLVNLLSRDIVEKAKASLKS